MAGRDGKEGGLALGREGGKRGRDGWEGGKGGRNGLEDRKGREMAGREGRE